MSAVDFLVDAFRAHSNREAIIWNGESYSYEWLSNRLHYWMGVLISNNVEPGTVAILEADFSPNSVALLLALVQAHCIVVPLTKSVEGKKSEFIEIAGGMLSFRLDEHDNATIKRLNNYRPNEFYDKLRQLGHPGLVLFSSGSTGKSKAAVHDFAPLLEKFKVSRHALRTISFLLFDHIGGVNTLFYTLSNGGCVITVQDRMPDNVLRAIQNFRVELLPTSPTFINLILLSEAYQAIRPELFEDRNLRYRTHAGEHAQKVQRLISRSAIAPDLRTFGSRNPPLKIQEFGLLVGESGRGRFRNESRGRYLTGKGQVCNVGLSQCAQSIYGGRLVYNRGLCRSRW